MARTVSDKSTKTEILEAYNEILVKSKEQKAADQKAARKEAEDKEIVKTAAASSVEEIVTKLAGLKLEIVKSIDGLEEKLIAEHKRFTELRHAVAIETSALDEMYGIQAEIGTLSTLVLSQKERKETFQEEMEEKKAVFDSDMAEKKQQWKKEQDEFEAAKKERDGQIKKERLREEEEYTYNLKLQRKKESDAYEARKTALEKELELKKETVEKDLAEREVLVAAREQELEDLRARVDTFPKELDKAVKETEKSVTEKIEFKYKYQAELAAKDAEGEKRLSKQMISALEKKIAEQEEQIRQLMQKADDSIRQVETIAVKAIEGASAQRIFADRPKDVA